MKLAFVIRRFGVDGGTERFLESLTRRLGQRGHEVDVYSASVDPRFARTRVASFKRLVAGGRGLLRNALLHLCAALQVRRRDYDAVVHLGRTGPLDVYRAGGGCHRTWLDLLLARTAGAPGRLRLRLSPGHVFRLWHERRALALRSRIVVPSERARGDMVAAYGGAAERVQVIHNGVDLDRFHPRVRQIHFEEERTRLGLRPEELVLLFVGSDYFRKGLDTVLAAAGRLVGSGRAEDLRLLVLGADRAGRRFAEMAAGLGLRDRVTFLHHHEAPERVYAAVDLLVLPTRHDPFANVTLEALACGVPVVTSAANGATEVVAGCQALAVLDDPDDEAGLAEAVEEMLRPEALPERRVAARAAVERCSERGAVDRWEALLREVAAERHGRG